MRARLPATLPHPLMVGWPSDNYLRRTPRATRTASGGTDPAASWAAGRRRRIYGIGPGRSYARSAAAAHQ